MRKQLLSAVAAVAVAVGIMAPRAEAQMVEQTRAVSFGLGGGATLPVGDLSNAFGTGWHAQAMLGFNALGVGMRVDGMWHSIPEDGHDHDLRVLAGVLNAMFRFAPGAQVQPYVSVGGGIYNFKLDEDDEDDSIDVTRFGINGGAGLRFRLTGMSSFVEVRYHNVFTEGSSTQIVPLTFGIMF